MNPIFLSSGTTPSQIEWGILGRRPLQANHMPSHKALKQYPPGIGFNLREGHVQEVQNVVNRAAKGKPQLMVEQADVQGYFLGVELKIDGRAANLENVLNNTL